MIIGESIFIMNRHVSRAVERREKAHIQELALKQVEAGADYLDLNIGPQRRTGPEVMTWMVETIQEVTDTPLSLDTANTAAIEAGLKICKQTPIINSTDSSDARLNAMMPLAVYWQHSCPAGQLPQFSTHWELEQLASMQ